MPDATDPASGGSVPPPPEPTAAPVPPPPPVVEPAAPATEPTQAPSTTPPPKEKLIPDLALPEHQTPQAPEEKPVRPGFKRVDKNKKFKVRIAGQDFGRYEGLKHLLPILGGIYIFFCFICWLIGHAYEPIGEARWMFSISFFITGIITMIFHNYLGLIQVDALKAKIYTNNVRADTVDAYPSGFGIRPFYLTPFNPHELDFQRDEKLSDEMSLRTLDGLPVKLKFELLRRWVEEGIKEALGFSPTTVDYRVKAEISERLQQLFGMNSWETINKHRVQVMEWVSQIFGDEDEQSPFEKHFGILVYNPKLVEFKTEGAGANEITQAKAEADKFREIVVVIKEKLTDISDDEAARIAQRILGQNLPESRHIIDTKPGVHTAVIGDSVGTVVGRGGHGRKGGHR